MVTPLASVALALSLASAGGFGHGLFGREDPGYWRTHAPHGTIHPGGRIVPPGPGYGWGFPNGNPDGYGWVDYGDALPLGADRTTDYYARRYFMLPAEQVFFPTYYNPYVQRGQRFIPYTGCGGAHPFGGPAPATSVWPVHPYGDTAFTPPVTPVPEFSGRTQAAPIPSGGSSLIP